MAIQNYLIIFANYEDGEISTHVRGLAAGSEAELAAAEAMLRKQYAPLHLRSIHIQGDPMRTLFRSLSLLRAEEAERA